MGFPPRLFGVSSWTRDLLVADQRRANERGSNEIECLIVWCREDVLTINFSAVLRVMNVEAVWKESELRFALTNQ